MTADNPSFGGIGFCVGLKLEVLRDQVSKVYFCNRHKPQMSKITIPNVYMMHIWSVWWVFKRYMTGAKIITGRKFGWLRNVHGLLHGVQLDGVSWSIVYCIPIALVPPQEVGLTKNQETMTLQQFTTYIYIYIWDVRPTWIGLGWNIVWNWKPGNVCLYTRLEGRWPYKIQLQFSMVRSLDEFQGLSCFSCSRSLATM